MLQMYPLREYATNGHLRAICVLRCLGRASSYRYTAHSSNITDVVALPVPMAGSDSARRRATATPTLDARRLNEQQRLETRPRDPFVLTTYQPGSLTRHDRTLYSSGSRTF